MKTESHFIGAVAFLDILGFSEYFQPNREDCNTRDLADIRDEIVGTVIQSAAVAYLIAKDDFNHLDHHYGAQVASRPGILFFADSVVLYLPMGEKAIFSKPETIIESMIYMCSLLIADSLCQNIPLRGAISFGECIVSHDPVYILGKPFIEAHKLESKQMWAGAVLAESAKAHYHRREIDVVDYNVPCKSNGQLKRIRYTSVTWPRNVFGSNNEASIDWHSCFKCSSIDNKILNDVQTKKENTKEFFDLYRNLPAGKGFRPGRKSACMGWREMYGLLNED